MALIDCEECGREVSDKARSCPGCGAPIAGEGSPAPRTEEADAWTRLTGSHKGPQEVVVRGTDVGYEAEKLGARLMTGFLALFLHPRFAFVGFYLLCLFFVAAAVAIGGEWLGLDIDNAPGWVVAMIFALPVPLVYLLRAYVRTVMKWLLIVLAAILVINILIWLFF
ncbi:MAG: zinc ribbon domain-containing protein [Chromatiales bacterium]|nr:zinc ribbon domain-containing protein [Chromatiales bacterium]